MERKGFTMIEVALVLALAGLIFMMTFLALPSLWASERDSQRREDMMTFVTKLKSFQTNNNRGALPGSTGTDKTTLDERDGTVTVSVDSATREITATDLSATSWAGFYRDFLPTDFADPNGNYYSLSVQNCLNSNDASIGKECRSDHVVDELSEVNETIYVAIGAVCEGDKAVSSANNRRVAVMYKLEHSGQYCYND